MGVIKETTKNIFRYVKNVFVGIWRLLQGMYITMLNFVRPKVTRQYPENRGERVYPERFRAMLTMPHDEDNFHKCTACKICEMNCPNGTIQVVQLVEKDEETGRNVRILDKYLYDVGSCIFCSLCVQSCPQNAIEWSNDFEQSVFNKHTLVTKLNEEGSMLKPKEPKKPAAPKAEAPKVEKAKEAKEQTKESKEVETKENGDEAELSTQKI